MHPDPIFEWTDEAAMRRFVSSRGFAHLCVAAGGRAMVAHVPVIVTEEGTLRFHLACANRVAPFLDGANAVASIAGADFYVSPDWYGIGDQVPTWNYVAIEVEGVVHALDDAALDDQIDRLNATFEATLAPKPAWTRTKMSAPRFDAMRRAIGAYELRAIEWRGTVKLGQNKPAAARASVALALAAIGREAEARVMREGAPR